MGRLYPCIMKKTGFYDDWRQYLLPFDNCTSNKIIHEYRNSGTIDFFKAKSRLKQEKTAENSNMPNIS